MADEKDAADKTEEPTGKRLSDATDKGQIPRSQEVNHWFMMGGLSLTLIMFAASMGRTLVDALLPYLERPHEMAVEFGSVQRLLLHAASGMAAVLAPAVLVAVLAALGASFLQHPPVVSTERLKPQLQKLSPIAGLGRLFSRAGLMEFLKGVMKVAIVSAVAVGILWPEIGRLGQMVSLEPLGLLTVAKDEVLKLLTGILAVLGLIAIGDVLFQRFEHRRRLRMSRQEVKDEHKQTEGDPQIKARIRSVRQERARKRMMAAVPTATVVVTNPTHFAVALKYDGTRMEAPVVVAKGADHVAARIREIATENDVPIVENPPLARALYAAADIDAEIPVEHYKAVAEIIGFVMRQNARAALAAVTTTPPPGPPPGGNR
jgi:flagellar biosynthetic protein FlhB